MTHEQIREMNKRGVIVVTHSGLAVGMGRLEVSAATDGGGLRVDLQFETPSMRCILGVPAPKLETLARSWDGASYRYSLPPGDKIWLPPEDAAVSPSTPPQPIIETFPLPVSMTPPVPIAKPLKKWR
jgi:hypothetical protein